MQEQNNEQAVTENAPEVAETPQPVAETPSPAAETPQPAPENASEATPIPAPFVPAPSLSGPSTGPDVSGRKERITFGTARPGTVRVPRIERHAGHKGPAPSKRPPAQLNTLGTPSIVDGRRVAKAKRIGRRIRMTKTQLDFEERMMADKALEALLSGKRRLSAKQIAHEIEAVTGVVISKPAAALRSSSTRAYMRQVMAETGLTEPVFAGLLLHDLAVLPPKDRLGHLKLFAHVQGWLDGPDEETAPPEKRMSETVAALVEIVKQRTAASPSKAPDPTPPAASGSPSPAAASEATQSQEPAPASQAVPVIPLNETDLA